MSVIDRDNYDVIVIGVGGMGSATVYQLAKRGLRVLGIERYGIPHEMGSSHGLTRIIRLAYHEGPEYVPLGRRAYELWRELEEETGQRVLHITGSIHAGSPGSTGFRETLRSCIDQQVAHEVLTSRDLADRYLGYQLPDDMTAVFQAEGGFLVPELCIEGHVSIARRFGAVIHERERVLGWEPIGTGVRVHTDHGAYAARSLVVTAGAWAGQVVQELHEIAVPERQVMAWFEPLKPALFEPSRFPVFIVTWNDDEYYGFPAYGVPGFKVGKFHHVGEDVDPDHLDRRYRTEDEHMLRDFTDACFPQAAGRLLKMTTCMFTNSPDRHFIIGQHSTYPQVSFAAGFSGHGFKFCSTVGEVMADLADRGKTEHDISSFDPARFEA